MVFKRKEIRVFHAGKQYRYSNWIPNAVTVHSIEAADLVLFEGGADISPSIYKEEKHRSVYPNLERDKREIEIWTEAQKLGKKCLGICRGAQLLCALSGGKLVQHMVHPNTHWIKTIDGRFFNINSTHHQMQMPFNLKKDEYKILAWAQNISSYHWLNDEVNIKNMPKEPELVFYSRTDSLCCQCHPEDLDLKGDFVDYLTHIFMQFMDNSLPSWIDNNEESTSKQLLAL